MRMDYGLLGKNHEKIDIFEMKKAEKIAPQCK
jgi:hypothetical protein